MVFPCTPLVYSLGALCSFFIFILFFTDQKKKKKLIFRFWMHRHDARHMAFTMIKLTPTLTIKTYF